MNPELLARARGLLAQASVIAEAGGVSFVPKGDRQYGTSDPTTGKGGDTFSFFAVRLSGCRSDRDLDGFCEALQGELDGIRKRPVAPKVKTKNEVLFGCWSEHHSSAVASASGVGERMIMRWREAAGQSPTWGLGRRKAA